MAMVRDGLGERWCREHGLGEERGRERMREEVGVKFGVRRKAWRGARWCVACVT